MPSNTVMLSLIRLAVNCGYGWDEEEVDRGEIVFAFFDAVEWLARYADEISISREYAEIGEEDRHI